MKKLLIILILFLPHYLNGTVSIEGDVSAFFPTNRTLRAIYGKVWQNYGVTIDHLQPFSGCLEPLSFFAQVNYLFSKGHSTGGCQRTHIRLVPITFGLKWIQKVHDKIEAYIGIAPRYYYMKTKNCSTYVPRKAKDHGCGVYTDIGAFFYPIHNVMVNLFFDYSYKKFKAPSSKPGYQGFSTNVSGVNLGMGIGWHF